MLGIRSDIYISNNKFSLKIILGFLGVHLDNKLKFIIISTTFALKCQELAVLFIGSSRVFLRHVSNTYASLASLLCMRVCWNLF